MFRLVPGPIGQVLADKVECSICKGFFTISDIYTCSVCLKKVCKTCAEENLAFNKCFDCLYV